MTALFSKPVEIHGRALFLSDIHLRTPEDEVSQHREELLLQLLSQEKERLKHLFLLGDIFDFWFEYRDVAPKGYFRLFNMFYELYKKGVKIYFFTGNHDMWVKDYFTTQFGCQIFRSQQAFIINGKRCLVGHGDGLGGKQRKYLLMKSILGYNPNQKLYSLLHPRHAFSFARYWSHKSRIAHPDDDKIFKNEEEPQIQYARQVLSQESVDYFIYAHRHIPIQYALSEQSTYLNTGEWLNTFSYIVLDDGNEGPQLLYFTQSQTDESATEKTF